jgi:hypothetical protein
MIPWEAGCQLLQPAEAIGRNLGRSPKRRHSRINEEPNRMFATYPSTFTTQKFLNGEVHNWYRIVLGYPDHLVGELLERLEIRSNQSVLDPFCGTGTTLIECMKRGIHSVGIDANPASCFAARVKTTWNLKGTRLCELLEEIKGKINEYLRRGSLYRQDPTYIYLDKSGMLERGWISCEPLRKAIAVKSCISQLRTTVVYKNALMLALIAEVVYGGSNMRFGPEIYCGPAKVDADIFSGFVERVTGMIKDLAAVCGSITVQAKVLQGDSRECNKLIGKPAPGLFSAIICSPPYPTEHDYTRNARLELAFLEQVTDRKSLQLIKKNMIRSHTKGIYKEDNDGEFVMHHGHINAITSELKEKIASKTHGFARLYPTVTREYFGGMKRHFISVKPLLCAGARCAYVVGDQSSYLRVHIPTAEILSSIAQEVGFDTVDIKHWRSRWSSTTSKEIHEHVLLLRNRD